MGKYKRDKKVTKLYKKFKSLSRELYNVVEKRDCQKECKTAADMGEKYISDNLVKAKFGMIDVLNALFAAEKEGKHLEEQKN